MRIEMIGCSAEDCGLDGFHVSGDFDVKFDSCKATRTGGSGFYFESQLEPLNSLIEQIRQELASDAVLAPQAAAINAQLTDVQLSVKEAKATKSGLKAIFSTIGDKLQEKTGVIAGHAIYHLLEKAPEIIDSIRIQ